MALAVLVATGGCGGSETPAPSPTTSPATVQPLPPAVGGRIAYAAGTSSNSDVYVLDIEGSQPVKLTDDGAFKQWPRWSPDGQRLAFVSWPGAQGLFGKSGELAIMAADGSERQTVSTVASREIYSPVFDWSPDSQAIVLEATGRSDGVAVGIDRLDPAIGELAELAQGTLGVMPAWSPDGSSILFVSLKSGQQSLGVSLMQSDGSNLHALVSDEGIVGPLWSPDGTRIVWWQRKSGLHQEMFVTDVNHPKAKSLGDGSRPTWSPDGQHIAFLDQTDEGNIDVYVMNVDTGERINVSNDPATDEWPAWAPDGTRIAFVSQRDNPKGDIYLVNSDGSNLTRLTDDEVSESMLEWAPPQQ